jgi:hypothetical protein
MAAASSAYVKAPNRLNKPATTHTAKSIFTEPTFAIIVLGTRKTPLPITVPITIETALHKPRTLWSDGAGAEDIVRKRARPGVWAIRS